MTPEQSTALIVALTGLVAAVGAIYAQLRQTHALMNSRMSELIRSTHQAAQKQGELLGRDWSPAPVIDVLRKVGEDDPNGIGHA